MIRRCFFISLRRVLAWDFFNVLLVDNGHEPTLRYYYWYVILKGLLGARTLLIHPSISTSASHYQYSLFGRQKAFHSHENLGEKTFLVIHLLTKQRYFFLKVFIKTGRGDATNENKRGGSLVG